MATSTTGSKRTYEFRVHGAMMRAVAESKYKAAQMVADAAAVGVEHAEFQTDYDPRAAPVDHASVRGHPFEDGDRIAFDPDEPTDDAFSMTVNLSGDRVTFTEETAPYGIRTLAEMDTPNASERPDNTLRKLYQYGWRKIGE